MSPFWVGDACRLENGLANFPKKARVRRHDASRFQLRSNATNEVRLPVAECLRARLPSARYSFNRSGCGHRDFGNNEPAKVDFMGGRGVGKRVNLVEKLRFQSKAVFKLQCLYGVLQLVGQLADFLQ